MKRGYYLMHRGWMKNPAFAEEPFTEREAFEWLIAEAAWADNKRVSIKRQPVVLNRGQLSHAMSFMAEAWKWKRARVQRFLNRLKKWSMIDTQADTGQCVITICNYEEYQNPYAQVDTEAEEKAITPRSLPDHKKKETNTINEGKKKAAPYSPQFEEAWKAYPTTPNMSKHKGWQAWQKATRPEADLVAAVKAYAAFLSKPDAPYAAHFATFFNEHRYEGFLSETDKAVESESALTELRQSLTGISRNVCEALGAEVFKAWLTDATILDGQAVTIIFTNDFRRDFFRTHYAGKIENALRKNVDCTTRKQGAA